MHKTRSAANPARLTAQETKSVQDEQNLCSSASAVNNAKNETGFPVSIFKGIEPTKLSKSVELDPDGNLNKIPGGQMAYGTVQTKRYHTLSEFAAKTLSKLKPCHALAYGVCDYPQAEVFSKIRLETAKPGSLPMVSRSQSFFRFSEGPALMMIDADAPKAGNALTEDELLTILFEVWPEMANAPYMISHSSTSHIHNDETGIQLIGQRGLRIHVLVANGADIPRAGKILFRRLVMAGYGRIEFAKNGRRLRRSTIDGAVFQAERFDFCAGMACKPPLVQRRPEPRIYNDDAQPLDTRKTLPNLTPEETAKFEEIDKALLDAALPTSEEIEDKWVDERVAEDLRIVGKTVEDCPHVASKLKRIYRAAVKDDELSGDFRVGLGDNKFITVNDLLKNRSKYQGMYIPDPTEPEYGNGRSVAWINAEAGYIWTHAHGGKRYNLRRARKTIKIYAGQRARLVEEVLQVMRENGDLFDRGGEIVRVTPDAKILPRGVQGVLMDIDRVVRCEKFFKKEPNWRQIDAPKPIADGILESSGQWKLPKLVGVVTAPTYDPRTKQIVDTDGFHKSSGLLLLLGDVIAHLDIPDCASKKQLRDAVETLWKPFEQFPWVSNLDVSVYLAAILTTIIRPALPTAPGFGITASTPGSGKSLLSKCLAALASNQALAIMSGVKEDEEMRKRLLSLGRSGAPVIVLDNLNGFVSSDALCAWLTSEVFSDRVLGTNTVVNVPTRSVLVLNGNNFQVEGDLCRRVLTCRIEPGVEQPWNRDFSLDPEEHCREHRLEMVAAGLTLIKAYSETAPLPKTGSFEVWSEAVRKTVIRIGEDGLMDVVNPTRAIDVAFAEDPDLAKHRATLLAWWACFRDAPMTIAEAISYDGTATETKPDAFTEPTAEAHALREAFHEVAGDRAGIDSRRAGQWVAKKEKRIVEGLRFERGTLRKGVMTWTVKKVA